MAAAAKVLIADDDEAVRLLLESVLAESLTDFEVVAVCEDGTSAVEMAARLKPDLALLDVRMPGVNGLEACRRIRAELPDCVVIMISALGDEEYVREATAVGARDYITKPFKVEELLETMRSELALVAQQRTALESRPGRGEKLSRVWAFWSPRSGVGVSSLALNAALELVRANQSTLFVDLDLVFSDCEQLLGLQRMYDLSDLVDHQGAFDIASARTRIENHPSGLRCLYQHDPRGSVKLASQHVQALIHGMGSEFRYLVLDLPPDLGDRTGVALELADTIWLVAGPDPVGARNITKALGLFHQLGYPRTKIRLLLNRANRKNESVIRSLLPDAPAAVFPDEPDVFQEAVRTAHPAVLCRPSSGFSRAMKSLMAQCLALTTDDLPSEPSLKDRFLKMLRGS